MKAVSGNTFTPAVNHTVEDILNLIKSYAPSSIQESLSNINELYEFTNNLLKTRVTNSPIKEAPPIESVTMTNINTKINSTADYVKKTVNVLEEGRIGEADKMVERLVDNKRVDNEMGEVEAKADDFNRLPEKAESALKRRLHKH